MVVRLSLDALDKKHTVPISTREAEGRIANQGKKLNEAEMKDGKVAAPVSKGKDNDGSTNRVLNAVAAGAEAFGRAMMDRSGYIVTNV